VVSGVNPIFSPFSPLGRDRSIEAFASDELHRVPVVAVGEGDQPLAFRRDRKIRNDDIPTSSNECRDRLFE
jgi:hypothetical protein